MGKSDTKQSLDVGKNMSIRETGRVEGIKFTNK